MVALLYYSFALFCNIHFSKKIIALTIYKNISFNIVHKPKHISTHNTIHPNIPTISITIGPRPEKTCLRGFTTKRVSNQSP